MNYAYCLATKVMCCRCVNIWFAFTSEMANVT